MTTDTIDLRSDTVTRPTPSMRRAMAEAAVGDDVYGEDPTLNRLQEEAAALLGKEAALFCPSGTMANLIAVLVHTRPGDEVVCESDCHVYNYEAGAMAAVAGVLPRPVKGRLGVMDPGDVVAAIRAKIYYLAQTSLLCVENTHNLAGGTVVDVIRCRELAGAARDHGLASHLDGARIFNAAAALGVEAAEIAAPFDSLMFCISKGLSAPAGSLLLGTGAFIEEARRIRKRIGGGMRQAGILAAAGLVALREIVPLLGEDHRRAKALAEVLADHPVFECRVDDVHTNIIVVTVRGGYEPGETIERLAGKGLLCGPAGGRLLRFVTHREITDGDLERAVEILRDFR